MFNTLGDESFKSEGEVAGDASLQISVQDAPIDANHLEMFLKKGRTVKAKVHPYLSEGLAWISGPSASVLSRKNAPKSLFDAVEGTMYPVQIARPGSIERPDQWQMTLQLSEVFDEFQIQCEQAEENPNFDIGTLSRETSRSYRSKLTGNIDTLSRKLQSDGLTEGEELFLQETFDCNSVWQCAEAIYFNTKANGFVCDDLMDWVNTMEAKPSQEDGENIMTAKTPCLHPLFWDYVSKGVLRGLFEMVATCLKNSGLETQDAAASRATVDLILLLQGCPRVTTYGTQPKEFITRYRHWRGKVVAASKSLNLSDQSLSSSFRQVYELLKGDKDAIFRQSETWQECVAAMALLSDPTGTKNSKGVKALFELVTEAEDAFQVDYTLDSEYACASFCVRDIPKAISHCRLIHLSLATHLSDLLEKREVLDDIREGELDFTIRDLLVLDLGDACISDLRTWKSAITYWRTIPEVGPLRIQQVVPRIPINSQSQVDEVLAICHDMDLVDEAAEIETVWARKLETSGQYGTAINAYDSASNPGQIDRLNWLLMKKSLLKSQPASNDQDLINLLYSPQTTNSPAISAILAPYASLTTFYDLKTQGNRADSAFYLASLLKCVDLPKSLTPLLMAEMLPLLDGRAFALKDVIDVLAAVEEFYDSTYVREGLNLLSEAMKNRLDTFDNPSVSIADWRSQIPSNFEPPDVLALVRLRIAHSISAGFCEE